MDDLLKEAIADAKAVRETALANAKIALEEAFTPRLKSMLSQKIQSEAGEDEDWKDEEEDEEGGEEEEPEVAVEPEAGEEEGDEYEDEEEEPEAEEDDEEEPEMEEEGIIEIDGVKYAPVVQEDDEEPVADDEEEEPEMEEEGAEDAGEDLDLEAILRELEDEIKEDEEEDPSDVTVSEEEDVQVETVDVDGKTYYRFNEDAENIEEEEESEEVDEDKETEEVDESKETEEVDEDKETEEVDESKEDLEETIDLEDVLEALSEEDDDDEEEKDKAETVESLTSDLEEHRRVVRYLRSKLNEVNLLNAKLLFTNKLFRAHGLSEDQKYKVVEQFDRAQTLREVKLVYATLAESFSVGAKREIKESKGAASKPVSSTKPSREPEVLQEGAELRDRFKKLANIL